MNRLLKFTTLFIAIIGCFMLIKYFPESATDKRLAYESFLEKEFISLDYSMIDPAKDSVGFTNPGMAALQNYYMTIDPNLKRVPTERLKQAYLKTKSIKKKFSLKFGADDIQWQAIDSDMGGRTRAIMFDPNDANKKKVWAGSVTGGLWYNNDISSTSSAWTAIESFWSSLAISCIVHDPNNSQNFYVGTGEAETARTIYRESSGIGGGIWTSTDGGSNWSVIPSTTNFKYVTDIVIRNEAGTSVIYAGVTSGVYKGSDHESLPSDGLYRSADNGTTWEQVLPNIVGFDKPFAPADVKIGPGGRIFIGTMRNLDGNGGSTILYSDLGTTGSWTIYDDFESQVRVLSLTYNIPGRVIVAPAPSNENRIYAIFGAGWVNSNNGFIHSKGQYILRSDNNGASWYRVNIPGLESGYYWSSLSWHAFEATVNPTDSDILYVGGLDVYRTTDGGTTWSQMSDWRGTNYGFQYVHADIHRIMYKPGSSEELIIATDGGVFRTSNATDAIPLFQSRNKSYGTLQFYTCAIAPESTRDEFLGGLQDNGTLLYTGSTLNESDAVSGGDGSYCFFDQDENLSITSIYYNRYIRFKNNVYSGRYEDFKEITGTFINPADYDWKNNILYANGVTFLRNNKNTILRISKFADYPVQELVTMTSGVNAPFSNLKVSPFSPINKTTLFAGTESGRLFKITNAQGALSDSEEIGSTDFPTGYISSIDVGGSEDSLIVSFSNYGISSIWQSYDAGKSWQEKEGNLPDMPIRWIIYHPQNSRKAMIATETGVWFTDELDLASPEWSPVNDGLANVRVDMLKVRDSDHLVLAATHGRGLTVASFGPFGIDDPEIFDETFSVAPNPATDFVNIKLAFEKPETLNIQLFDYTGKLVLNYDEGTQQGQYTKTIDVSYLQAGIYILKLITPTKVLSHKLVIN